MTKESTTRIFEPISEQETKQYIERKIEELEKEKQRFNFILELCRANMEEIEKEVAEWTKRSSKLKEK